MRARFWVTMGAAIALVACAPAAPDVRAPAEGETSITGAITIEDGAYPMFVVHVQAEGQEPLSLNLNAEDSDLGGQTPGDFEGKTALVYYTTAQENDLIDMRAAGLSLTGANGDAPAGSSITGQLSGAEEASGGDLPDRITVTDAQGNAVSFDYFITPEMAGANSEQVTAYYTTGDASHVTLMRVAE